MNYNIYLYFFFNGARLILIIITRATRTKLRGKIKNLWIEISRSWIGKLKCATIARVKSRKSRKSRKSGEGGDYLIINLVISKIRVYWTW